MNSYYYYYYFKTNLILLLKKTDEFENEGQRFLRFEFDQNDDNVHHIELYKESLFLCSFQLGKPKKMGTLLAQLNISDIGKLDIQSDAKCQVYLNFYEYNSFFILNIGYIN